MINQKDLLPQKLAKTWPYKCLNALPHHMQEKYLLWKSNRNFSELSFELHKSLGSVHSALIFLPEGQNEFYLSIPLLHFLSAQPKKMDLVLVGRPDKEAFATSLFPRATFISLPAENFFWGDSHFNAVQKKIKLLRPNLSLHLHPRRDLLGNYLHKISHAPLRIGFGNDSNDYDNITLEYPPGANIIYHFQKVAELFQNEGFARNPNLIELRPNAQNLQEILRELSHFINISKNRILTFIWDDNPRQKKIQVKLLEEAHKTLVEKKLALKIVCASLQPTESENDIPQNFSRLFPCFKNISTGKLIALICQSHFCFGVNSPGLHLANLCQQSVYGAFLKSENPYDSSEVFKLFKPHYFPDAKSISMSPVLSMLMKSESKE